MTAPADSAKNVVPDLRRIGVAPSNLPMTDRNFHNLVRKCFTPGPYLHPWTLSLHGFSRLITFSVSPHEDRLLLGNRRLVVGSVSVARRRRRLPSESDFFVLAASRPDSCAFFRPILTDRRVSIGW